MKNKNRGGITMKPTSAEKYDFINEHLMKLDLGGKHTVVMEGRVYTVVYKGPEKEYFVQEA